MLVKRSLAQKLNDARLKIGRRYLLSPAHWDRIFKASYVERIGMGYASACYARGYQLFDRGYKEDNQELIVRARGEWETAAMTDPGMCDAYLGLIVIEAYAQSLEDNGKIIDPRLTGLDDLGLLSAAATVAHRYGQEQRLRTPFQIAYSPIVFNLCEVHSPDDLRLYYASQLLLHNQFDLAGRWLSRVQMDNPARLALEAKLSYFRREFADAALMLDPVIDSDSNLRPSAIWLQANALLNLQEFELAIDKLEEALEELTPEESGYRYIAYSLASAYGMVGRDDDRRRLLEDLFRIDPTFLDVPQLLGLDLPDGVADVSPTERAWQQIVAGLRSS